MVEAGSKLGVFIQGPLVSVGRTGQSLSSDPEETGVDSRVISFNCIENINQSYNRYLEYFDEVLVILWESDRHYISEIEIPTTSILIIPDVEIKNDKNQYETFRNSQKQYYSSLRAIEELQRRNCAGIVKTRSDQTLKAEALYESLKDTINVNSILFPYRDQTNFDMLSDFYIGGLTHHLLDVFESLVYQPRYSKNVHLDIYYKCWIYFQTRGSLRLRNHRSPVFFDSIARPIIVKFAYKELSNLLMSEDTNWLGTFNKTIWENLKWRGRSVSESDLKVHTFKNLENGRISWYKLLLIKVLLGRF